MRAATEAPIETETDALLCGISTTSWMQTRHYIANLICFVQKELKKLKRDHPKSSNYADQPTGAKGGSVSLFAAVAAAAAAAIAAAALVRDSAALGTRHPWDRQGQTSVTIQLHYFSLLSPERQSCTINFEIGSLPSSSHIQKASCHSVCLKGCAINICCM